MPSSNAKRNLQNLSHEVKTSCYMGKLVPVMCKEVIPGDIWNVQSEALVRLAPMLAPIMHRVDVYLHYFFVPNRLVMDDWESFITGGEDGEDATVHPYITIPGGGFAKETLADYLGIPAGIGDGEEINALPFRGYQLIWQEWYRDQDLQDKPTISKASGSDTTTTLTLQSRCWQKDYFTKCRPATKKGPDVEIPISTTEAPVKGLGKQNQNIANPSSTWYDSEGDNPTWDYATTIADGVANTTFGVKQDASGNPNLTADLTSATATDINTIREAFGLQRLFERLMRGGGRYTEYLQNIFGVKAPDARLQRPEFLGGGKSPVVVSEVLQTSESGSTPQGEMAGHGFSAQQTHRFKKMFVEHGFVFALMSIVPKTAYYQGLEKHFCQRTTRYDYAHPELSHIGEQAVLNKEIKSDHATADEVFGYLPQYEEYRTAFDKVSGDFRDTLDFWHMARDVGADPALNNAFVTCTPTMRVFAVTDQAPCWVQLYHSIKALRPLPKYGEPGLLDH